MISIESSWHTIKNFTTKKPFMHYFTREVAYLPLFQSSNLKTSRGKICSNDSSVLLDYQKSPLKLLQGSPLFGNYESDKPNAFRPFCFLP